jgi:hypothetical protein
MAIHASSRRRNIEAAALTLPESVLTRLNALPPATGARN